MKMCKKFIAVLLSTAMFSTATIQSLLLTGASDVPEKTAYATYRVEDADGFSEGFQFEAANDGSGGESAKGNGAGEYFVFKNMNFEKNVLQSITFNSATAAGGVAQGQYYGKQIEIRIDSLDGDIIGSFAPKNTGNWQNWQDVDGTIIDKISGVHDVYFCYLDGTGNINKITFNKGASYKYAYDWYNLPDNADTTLSSPEIADVSLEDNGTDPEIYGSKNYPDNPAMIGKHIVLKDIDFCTDILGGMELRYTTAAGGSNGTALGAQIEIWVDAATTEENGKQIGTWYGRSTGGWTGNWENIKGVITEEVTGVHNIYLKIVKADGRINAMRFLKKDAKEKSAYQTFNAPGNIDVNGGLGIEGDINLRGAKKAGDYFGIKNLNFGKFGLGGVTISQATAAAVEGTLLEIRLDSPTGNKIGEFIGQSTDGWSNWTDVKAMLTSAVTEVHDVYFVYTKAADLNIHSVTFTETSNTSRSAYKRYYISKEWDETDKMKTESCTDGEESAINVTAIESGAYFKISQLDFGTDELGGVTFRQASATQGTVGQVLNTRMSIWIDGVSKQNGGTKIGTFAPKQTGGWWAFENVDGTITELANGVHDVYFVWDDTQYNIIWVQFKKGQIQPGDDSGVDVSVFDFSATSKYDGYNSIVDRPTTGDDNQYAYNYGLHLMKMDDGTYRAYTGGRWRWKDGDIQHDGDHVLLYASETGEGYTWKMVGDGPVFLQGKEEGKANEWYSNNQLEPEVMKLPDGTWIMYSQCEIEGGTPIDDADRTPSTDGIWADRIQVLTSKDGLTWTRKTDRGVIINIPDPTTTAFHHQEVIYVPWDKDGKPFWLYTATTYNGVQGGYIRIRSDKYDTFDYNAREATGGMSQLGNQIGYLKEAPTGPIFVRTTMLESNGRVVPALQYSGNGLTWMQPQTALKGSDNNEYNKNCYFVGFSTINGTGQIEYLGNNQWKFLYGSTTANSPVALSPDEGYGIWKSQIGGGSAILALSVKDAPSNPDYNLYKISTGCADDIISNLFPIKMVVEEDAQSNVVHMWSVDDTAIATIDGQGVLTPKKAGTVQVTLKADGHAKTCTVVIKEGIPTLETDDVRMLKGSTKQMTLKVALRDAEEKYTTVMDASKVDWSVSNTDLATISEAGLVTAKSNGKLKVIACLKDNANIKAELELTIVNGYIDIELQNSSAVDSISADMTPRMTAISYSIGSKDIVWSVDEKKATIKDLNNVDTPENNSNIKVMFKDSGKIVFRASLKDYPEVYSEVTFTVIPTKLELSMALDNATYFDMNNYTALRWNNLQKAISVARAVYDDEDATQAEINEAVALLERVTSELELADDVQTPAIPDQIGGSEANPEAPVKPGDSLIPDTFNDSLEIILGILLLGAAAAVVFKSLMKKKVCRIGGNQNEI